MTNNLKLASFKAPNPELHLPVDCDEKERAGLSTIFNLVSSSEKHKKMMHELNTTPIEPQYYVRAQQILDTIKKAELEKQENEKSGELSRL